MNEVTAIDARNDLVNQAAHYAIRRSILSGMAAAAALTSTPRETRGALGFDRRKYR
jgi:hypothetical protein